MSEVARRNRVLFALIAVLALAGAVVSAVALERHYAKSATDFCDLRQNFSCDIVNRSEYSTVADIPVAAIGVAGYALLFLLATLWRSRAETPTCLILVALAGLAFAFRLSYIEAYKLMTWCILCLISQFLILLIAVLAVAIKWRAAPS